MDDSRIIDGIRKANRELSCSVFFVIYLFFTTELQATMKFLGSRISLLSHPPPHSFYPSIYHPGTFVLTVVRLLGLLYYSQRRHALVYFLIEAVA